MLSTPANKKILNGLLLAALCLLAFITWFVLIAGNTSPDEKIFNAIAPYITDARTNFMKCVSFLGNHKFLIPANLLFIAFLIVRGGKSDAIAAGAIALSSLGSMSLLKNMVGRHRPPAPLVDGITNFSFPSGHAFMSVVFYGLLVWWAVRFARNRVVKISTVIFLSLLILLISFSRIYLRVHYTTDVVAGLCAGICWLWFCLWLTNKIKPASGFKPEH